jgi:cell division protease FtsH
MNLRRTFRGPIVWVIVAILVVFGLLEVATAGGGYKTVPLTTIETAIANHQVTAATLHDSSQEIQVTLAKPIDGATKLQSPYTLHYDTNLQADLGAAKTPSNGAIPTTILRDHTNPIVSLLIQLLPFVLLVVVMLFFLNQMQGGGGRVMQFGKAKAKLVSKDTPKTTFADVAGVDEAIEELQEIKEFLENPAKFQAIGAKIPKGVLLYGPPGTGKTLLARAVAGEAGVPFYSISGSDFVEMFVGVGASRVRDLFEQAKTNAPAIIFVDEIDAVGRHRGAGLGGGHDEREQTLNQMLVEMDGFDVNRGVILIAATNRPDILDPALLRPGRFDRQIVVDRPDLEGRRAILDVHAKGKPFSPDVDLGVIARRTPGFTGADLANVINEAALLTARDNGRQITNLILEESIDRVVAGPMRKTRVMSDKEKKVTAYHEGGHALVAWALPDTAPVHKISIVARGRSLGHTLVLPEEDKYNQTRSEMMDMLAYALGGRAAEELVFHEPTTGASNDIEKATATARAMVMTYGMSEKLGPLKFGRGEGDVFLGRDLGHERDFSEEVASQIDDEVRGLIERAHNEAWEILVKYRDVLDDMVLKLLDKETLTKADLTEIFASVGKRPSRDYSSSRKPPAGRPPVLTPAEIAKLDPKDLAALGHGNGNGSRSRTNGSKSNGAKSNGARANGSRTSASSRSRANQTAKPAANGRTARKRTGRQAPGTTA